MSTTITQGIRVSAENHYEPSHSSPGTNVFLFSYHITITNTGDGTVQLLRRKWLIRDSIGEARHVEGPGVVGETPVLAPGESYTYTSACDLHSAHGRMDGAYLMQHLGTKERFTVVVPTMHFNEPSTSN